MLSSAEHEKHFIILGAEWSPDPEDINELNMNVCIPAYELYKLLSLYPILHVG